MPRGPIDRELPDRAIVPVPAERPAGPPRSVSGALRAPRGMILGALIATPLWLGLLILARQLYSWVR